MNIYVVDAGKREAIEFSLEGSNAYSHYDAFHYVAAETPSKARALFVKAINADGSDSIEYTAKMSIKIRLKNVNVAAGIVDDYEVLAEMGLVEWGYS